MDVACYLIGTEIDEKGQKFVSPVELISYSTSSKTSLYNKAELIIQRKSTYISKKFKISDSILKRKRRELHSQTLTTLVPFYSSKKLIELDVNVLTNVAQF